ncbi:hypothetical protein T492DRAFT_840803 [Pavlovales sp. CCMP2436]|nr:hypothetical protein T492DRAFT_840803 [Pavlovales sp. CCMP2436]
MGGGTLASRSFSHPIPTVTNGEASTTNAATADTAAVAVTGGGVSAWRASLSPSRRTSEPDMHRRSQATTQAHNIADLLDATLAAEAHFFCWLMISSRRPPGFSSKAAVLDAVVTAPIQMLAQTEAAAAGASASQGGAGIGARTEAGTGAGTGVLEHSRRLSREAEGAGR